MKFLLDMPIGRKTADWFKSQGFDAVHARDIGLAKASDAEILNHALKENRILLTMDLDFPAILASSQAREPGVILLRLRNPNPALIQKHLALLLRTHQEMRLASAIVIIEDSRIRLRKLPII